MSRKFLTPIDLNGLQLLNALLQSLGSDPGSPGAGQIWYRSDTGTIKFRDNVGAVNRTLGRLDQIDAPTAAVNINGQQLTSALLELLAADPGSPADGRVWITTGAGGVLKARANGVTYVLGRLDQINAPTASVSMNSQKITSLADGTAATDAVTKQQLDAAQAGLDVKASVRAATTANITTLAGGAPNTLDGVTLAANDRILVKDQSTGSQNGIYTVTTLGTGANGTWTRATDADTSAEVNAGMFTFVEEGTANGDTGWVLTTNNPITLATTALVFSKFTAAATGVGKFTGLIGDGSTTAIAVTHGLGSQFVTAQAFDASSGAQIECDITLTSSTQVTFTFAVAPASNAIRVVIVG